MQLTQPVATAFNPAVPGAIGGTTPAAGAFTTLTANGAVTFTANTASTSTTTGTLVVTGGVGVSGSVYAAGFGVGITTSANFPFRASVSADASVVIDIANANAGTTASAGFQFTSDAGTAIIRQNSVLRSSLPGRLLILAPSGATGITYYLSGTGDTHDFWSDGVNRLSIADGGITATVPFIGNTQSLSGPGAANVTSATTKVTSTGALDAITLADGVNGQTKTVLHDVDGGSFVLTPTTRNNWASFTSTAAGESITLRFVTTRGWTVIGSYLGVIA